MEENRKEEVKDLVERIERLEKEAALYYGEAKEPIEHNIERLTNQLEENLKPCREYIEALEKEANGEIEKLEKEANERIERLEKEVALYYGEAREPIEYNIERIKGQLEEDRKRILTRLEEDKQKSFTELEKLGVELEKYGFKEKETPEETRPEETKPEETKPEGTKPEETKPEGTKPEGTKPEGTKPEGTKPEETKSEETKSEGTKPEETKPEETKQEIENDAVEIRYSAKKDEYKVKNVKTGEVHSVKRSDINKIEKSVLAEKMNKTEEDLMYISTDIYQILASYDKKYGTDKAKQYVDEATTLGKGKDDRLKEMKRISIDIIYDLKGIYGKQIQKEDRKIIFEEANTAKEAGIAKVKKGIIVFIGENAGKVISKISSGKLISKTKTLQLPWAKKKHEREVQKDQEYDKLVNKDYMQSLDGKYEEELKKTKKIKTKQAVTDFIKDKKNEFVKFAEEVRANVDEEEAAIEAERKATVKQAIKEEGEKEEEQLENE